MRKEPTAYGTVELHDTYAIGTINPGIDFDKDCADHLIELLNTEYGNRPFVYISNRIHDYSLNPAQAKRIEIETSIAGAAFVLVRRFSHQSFQTERAFYKLPSAAFDTLEAAISWSESLIRNLPPSR